MKKILIIIAIAVLFTSNLQAQAQWLPSGNNLTTTSNVGIGTVNPSASLDINEDSNSNWIHFNDGSGHTLGSFSRSLNGMQIGTWTGGTSHLILNPNGNVGIGTTEPQSKFHVEGDIRIPKTAKIILGNLSTGGYGEWIQNHNGAGISFFTNSTSQMTIENDGNVGIGTPTPQAKLHVLGASINNSSTEAIEANLIIQGTSTTRSASEGAAIGFVLPANTDGSNHWQQGRILVTPDNQNSYDASGSMYLQTRYSIPNAWAWRDNLVLKSNGDVGIGTPTPSARLDVAGGAIMITNSWDGVLMGRYEERNYHFIGTYQGWDNEAVYICGYNKGNNVGVATKRVRFGQQSTMTVDFESNKVGIGTTDFSGDHKLRVEGSIGAREIKVQASGWSDFVFEESYDLPSLEQVEAQIKEKGHLKDIPSAADVAENGIYLGEMDAKLLQKIEELTLYMIDLNKQVQTQKTEIEQLKAKNALLESK